MLSRLKLGANQGDWLQVNLSAIGKVAGVVIQGCPHKWVTTLKLQHSVDDTSYRQVQVLPSLFDGNTPNTQLLETPVSAQ